MFEFQYAHYDYLVNNYARFYLCITVYEHLSKRQNHIASDLEIEIPDLGPEYKNAEKILQDMLVLNPGERFSISLVIKKIDNAYPELKA